MRRNCSSCQVTPHASATPPDPGWPKYRHQPIACRRKRLMSGHTSLPALSASAAGRSLFVTQASILMASSRLYPLNSTSRGQKPRYLHPRNPSNSGSPTPCRGNGYSQQSVSEPPRLAVGRTTSDPDFNRRARKWAHQLGNHVEIQQDHCSVSTSASGSRIDRRAGILNSTPPNGPKRARMALARFLDPGLRSSAGSVSNRNSGSSGSVTWLSVRVDQQSEQTLLTHRRRKTVTGSA